MPRFAIQSCARNPGHGQPLVVLTFRASCKLRQLCVQLRVALTARTRQRQRCGARRDGARGGAHRAMAQLSGVKPIRRGCSGSGCAKLAPVPCQRGGACLQRTLHIRRHTRLQAAGPRRLCILRRESQLRQHE